MASTDVKTARAKREIAWMTSVLGKLATEYVETRRQQRTDGLLDELLRLEFAIREKKRNAHIFRSAQNKKKIQDTGSRNP
jgi:hypothetical protein